VAIEGVGETCPECGQGTLTAKRGRFGPFAGCSRYPDCKYIRKTGPPAPDQLPFEVVCPKCNEGKLVARRARRTGSVFYGCSRYPKCDFTSSREPIGALHDADDGPVAREGESGGICLKCGAPVAELPETIEVGMKLAGGEPDPDALKPKGRGGARGGARSGGGARRGGAGAKRGSTTKRRAPRAA
jgi:ssDNA-binding Zn-finger/Zn-ribbon topoisomerase 1